MKYAKQVDAGWGGEALGKGKAAMTIEGNWIPGALKNDFPNIKAQVVELPAGPAGKGTLLFSNCWGIAAKSKNQGAAVDLVKTLTSVEQQMAFAKAFGVMPSTTEGSKQYTAAFPDDAAFSAGGEYGTGPVNVARLRPGHGCLQHRPRAAGEQGPEGDPGQPAEERRRGPQGSVSMTSIPGSRRRAKAGRAGSAAARPSLAGCSPRR